MTGVRLTLEAWIYNLLQPIFPEENLCQVGKGLEYLWKYHPQEPWGNHPKKDHREKVSKVSLEFTKKAWLIKNIILNDVIFCLSLEGKRFNQVISYHHQWWVKYSVMWYPADGILAWNISPKKIPGIPELRGIPQNWSVSFKNISLMKDQGWELFLTKGGCEAWELNIRANPESNIASGNMTKSTVRSTNKIWLWTVD